VLDAFFLPAEPGERFCVLNTSESAPRGGIVYVHPFAEEMHKARRMAALQSRRLAAQGYVVLQLDLYGCGDSSGEFGQARWDIWRADVRRALTWLEQRAQGPLSLWGLRLGATLAAEVAADPELGIEKLLLWQPVIGGEQFLSQFLRLRLAAEMLSAGAATSALHKLRGELAQGHSLEIAGYELHPALAEAIDRLDLAALCPAAKRVHWLEVGLDAGAGLRRASQRTVERWQTSGQEVLSAVVAGDPFWSTVEIVECPALLDATTAALR
jgi:exosortase A-associated hydrolase 2